MKVSKNRSDIWSIMGILDSAYKNYPETIKKWFVLKWLSTLIKIPSFSSPFVLQENDLIVP